MREPLANAQWAGIVKTLVVGVQEALVRERRGSGKAQPQIRAVASSVAVFVWACDEPRTGAQKRLCERRRAHREVERKRPSPRKRPCLSSLPSPTGPSQQGEKKSPPIAACELDHTGRCVTVSEPAGEWDYVTHSSRAFKKREE